MYKLKFFLNFEKEEGWLQDMARNGWELAGVGVRYRFSESEKQEKNIRVDYRNFQNPQDFMDYQQFFTDCGWKHLAGSVHSGNQYFMSTRADADEDIFSDNASKKQRYRRKIEELGSLFAVFFIFAVSFPSTGVISYREMLSAEYYYPAGLWETSGIHFWLSFLGNTFLAVLRAVAAWIFPLGTVMLGILIFKIYLESRKKNK